MTTHLLPDDRFILPPTLIDFVNEVGVTGQSHDEYPAGGKQARYDHMRMALIALLSCQSSWYEPINYRVGTPWYDLNENALKIRTGAGVAGDTWSPFTDALKVGDTDAVTLTAWIAQVQAALAMLGPELVFNGSAASRTDVIPIPDSLKPALTPLTRPFVYVNGLLRDPRNCRINVGCPAVIELTEYLERNDKFTVRMVRIADQYFIPGDVVAG